MILERDQMNMLQMLGVDLEAIKKEAEVNRERFLAFKAKYLPLFSAVEGFYADLRAQDKSNHGHCLDHDELVAANGLMIGPGRAGELAALGGMQHSMDRHYVDEWKRDPVKDAASEKALAEKINQLMDLLPDDVTKEERLLIRDAIDKHSKPNQADDSLVLQILKDADRLANSGPVNLGRGGQHRPHVPGIELEYVFTPNPASTFKNITSLYDAWRYNMEWVAWLRMPKAKEIAMYAWLFGFTQLAIDMSRLQLVYAGIIDPEKAAV